jgi:hypothetical protein
MLRMITEFSRNMQLRCALHSDSTLIPGSAPAWEAKAGCPLGRPLLRTCPAQDQVDIQCDNVSVSYAACAAPLRPTASGAFLLHPFDLPR